VSSGSPAPDTEGQPGGDPSGGDALRTSLAADRTWLAAERTWLAWWRTGLGTAAVAIGVGRLLPGLTGGSKWPFRVLGLGYGVLAVAILVLGAARQRHLAEALAQNRYDQLSSPLVTWLTAAALILATATLAVIAVSL
jgi:putative membrane protein